MIDNATIKIASFRDLLPGWNFGEGVAPAERIIELATRLNAEAAVHGFEKSNAFPGSSGEIHLCFMIGKESVEFTINPDESITCAIEFDGAKIRYDEGLSFEDAMQVLEAY